MIQLGFNLFLPLIAIKLSPQGKENHLSQKTHIKPYKTIILSLTRFHLSLDKRDINNKIGFHI
tara:strand:+ start:369 stop:557 length:189 start_codon:yes stop_codon:yes gene_type:complete